MLCPHCPEHFLEYNRLLANIQLLNRCSSGDEMCRHHAKQSYAGTGTDWGQLWFPEMPYKGSVILTLRCGAGGCVRDSERQTLVKIRKTQEWIQVPLRYLFLAYITKYVLVDTCRNQPFSKHFSALTMCTAPCWTPNETQKPNSLIFRSLNYSQGKIWVQKATTYQSKVIIKMITVTCRRKKYVIWGWKRGTPRAAEQLPKGWKVRG